MKKRSTIIIILLSIITVILGITIVFLVTDKLHKDSKDDTKETLVENTGTKIMKVEGEEHISYIVEDYERNLTYTWSFPKTEEYQKNIKDNLAIDLNLRLSLDADTKDTRVINEKVDENKLIVTFDHHGILPETATVRINVGKKFENGDKLWLYYYNPEEDQIEYIDHKLKVVDGYVEFQIDHCSDYFLTGAVVNDAVGNPKNINAIIIVLGIVAFGLVAFTLWQSSKK